MVKKIQVLAFALLISATRNGVAAPPIAIPLEVAARSADAAAIVRVKSGAVSGKLIARYEIYLVKSIFGNFPTTKCIYSAHGLKIGVSYIVLLNDRSAERRSVPSTPCGNLVIQGTLEPAAFEIETFLDGKEYVRLENRRIAPPALPGAITVTQSLTKGASNSEIVIGTIVPVIEFQKFLSAARRTVH